MRAVRRRFPQYARTHRLVAAFFFHKPHWHTTLEAAEARVALMVSAKVKALRKQEARAAPHN